MAQVTRPGGTPATNALPARRPAAPVPCPVEEPGPGPVRGILAVEIAGFGRADRDAELREMLRQVLYRLLHHAFDDAGIGWRTCVAVDRGDAFLVIAPPAVPAAALAGPLLRLLHSGLALYNRYASAVARLRLRAGLHAGPAGDDAAGAAVLHTLRLATSQPARAALRTSAADLALIASDRLFTDAVRHGDGAVDPAAYQPVPLGGEDPGDARGWVALPAPGHPPAAPRPYGDRPDAGAWPGSGTGAEPGPETAPGGHPGVKVRVGAPPPHDGAGAVFGFFGNVTFGGDAVAGDKVVYM